MSLTSQLRDGKLGAWCAAQFTGGPELARQLTAATRSRRVVRPVGQVAGRHWAAIGGAFGARLAMLVQPAPPYYALYGLVNAGLVDDIWANDQAARYPTHTRLSADQQRRALDMRPIIEGWLDLDPSKPGVISPDHDAHAVADAILHGDTVHRRMPAEPVLAELFDRTRAYTTQHTPPGQLGSRGVEAGLARTCWLLEMFESVYRSGHIDESMHAVFRPGVPSVKTMRAAASEAVVEELVNLSHQLEAAGALADLRRLAGNPQAGQPLGIAGPVFVNHWADGDLVIVGPEGGTLVDVKTVIKTSDTERSARWLWQLLTYAWLDASDRYRIRNVGLYLARHGVLVTWDIDELADLLLGGGDRAAAQDKFRVIAKKVMAEEGAALSSVFHTQLRSR